MDEINKENLCFDIDIFTACNINDIRTVKTIGSSQSKSKEILSKRNNEGWTPLMYACYHGHKPIIKYLIEKSVDKSILNKDKQSAFMIAVRHDDVTILQLLYKEDLINSVDKYAHSPLFYAVEYGCYKSAAWLLKNKANPNHIEKKSGDTLIMIAVRNNDQKIAKLLLKYGADLDTVNKNGETALMLAAKLGQHSIAMLMEAHKGGNSLKKVLKHASLEKYWPVLEKSNVDLTKFLTMNEDDLKDVGIMLVGPRKKMGLLINEMNAYLMENISQLID